MMSLNLSLPPLRRAGVVHSHPGPVTGPGDQLNTRVVDLEHEIVDPGVPPNHEADIRRENELGSIPGPGIQNLIENH